MRLTHLILAHNDPELIGRLVKKLTSFSDVYIHIDKKVDIKKFTECVGYNPRCIFIDKRYSCNWGGWNAVRAEIELVKFALKTNQYDRLVFLQGADYPIKSSEYIMSYFEKYSKVEFNRACCISGQKDEYFSSLCCEFHFLNYHNFLERCINRVARKYCGKMFRRSGFIKANHKRYPVYWGSAQWAITGECAKYISDYYDTNKTFNSWFWHCFPSDELYFSTVIMNSFLAEMTLKGGPEICRKGLVNWRNLHYFEYLPGEIKILTEGDWETIKQRDELYIRKVSSKRSGILLDLIDDNI